MSERRIGAVSIAVEGRLQGIFTERDVLTRIVAPGLDPGETILGSVMTPNPDTVGPGDTALDALQRMSGGDTGTCPSRTTDSARVDEPVRPTIVRRWIPRTVRPPCHSRPPSNATICTPVPWNSAATGAPTACGTSTRA